MVLTVSRGVRVILRLPAQDPGNETRFQYILAFNAGNGQSAFDDFISSRNNAQIRLMACSNVDNRVFHGERRKMGTAVPKSHRPARASSRSRTGLADWMAHTPWATVATDPDRGASSRRTGPGAVGATLRDRP